MKAIIYIIFFLVTLFLSDRGEAQSTQGIDLIRDSIEQFTVEQRPNGKWWLTIIRNDGYRVDSIFRDAEGNIVDAELNPELVTDTTVFADQIYTQFRHQTNTKYRMRQYVQSLFGDLNGEIQGKAVEIQSYNVDRTRAIVARDRVIVERDQLIQRRQTLQDMLNSSLQE